MSSFVQKEVNLLGKIWELHQTAKIFLRILNSFTTYYFIFYSFLLKKQGKYF